MKQIPFHLNRSPDKSERWHSKSLTSLLRHIMWVLFDVKFLLFCIVNCSEKKIIKLKLKNVNKIAKSSLNNIFQDSSIKILSQKLTHDRSCISPYLELCRMKSSYTCDKSDGFSECVLHNE